MSDDTYHGVVAGVYALDLGDKLSAGAVTGDDVLHVYDVADFDEDGGFLRLGGTIYEYLTIDDDASTITLAVQLPLGWVSVLDDPVDVWDQANNQTSTIYKAVVDQLDGFDGKPFEAVVDQGLAHVLATTMREHTGESVTLRREDGALRVTGVHGRGFALAALQYLQGGMTTRQAEDESGVDIQGVDAGTPGLYVYDSTGEKSMSITADAAGGVQKFFLPLVGSTAGYINPGITPGGTPKLDLNSGTINTAGHVFPQPAIVSLRPGSGNGIVIFGDGDAGKNTDILVLGHLETTDFIQCGGALGVNGNIVAVNRITGTQLETTGPPTTTGTANVRIPSGGSLLNLITSLSKYKLQQETVTLESVLPLLDLTPKTWFDKGEVEDNDGSTEGLRRIPGLVAEDVEAHAPQLAEYDGNGDLQGVNYDRIAPLLIPIIRDQQERIERLEALVAQLLKEG